MPIYTFQTALNAMVQNPSIEAICYKMIPCGEDICSYLIERKQNCFWHCCEMSGPSFPEASLLWKRMVYTPPSFRGDIAEPLPAPSSPLQRQVATGYLSPTYPLMSITIPKSADTSPASGSLAPRVSPLTSPFVLKSPLPLSRQTSVEEEVTGIEEPVKNTHLFFDEHGKEISREEKDDSFLINVELSPHGPLRSFRHPRVLLFYLRYVASANELEETPWPLLTREHHNTIHNFIDKHPPPPEFEEDVQELFDLMKLCPTH
jgi:hypothetical protein